MNFSSIIGNVVDVIGFGNMTDRSLLTGIDADGHTGPSYIISGNSVSVTGPGPHSGIIIRSREPFSDNSASPCYTVHNNQIQVEAGNPGIFIDPDAGTMSLAGVDSPSELALTNDGFVEILTSGGGTIQSLGAGSDCP